MLCDKCGNNNADDSKFCQYCGSALIPPAPQPEQPAEPIQQQYTQTYQDQSPGQYNNQYQNLYQYQQPYNASRPLPNVLVWGILSFAFNFIGMSLLSIVFGIIGLNNSKQYKRIAGEFDNSASAGHALSIVGLVLGILITLAVIAVFVLGVIFAIEEGLDESFIEFYSVFMRTFNL